MPPSPTDEHQWLGGVIFRRMSLFVEERELGVVLTAPRDVLIRREPLRVRQPDILYLSAARAGCGGRRIWWGSRAWKRRPIWWWKCFRQVIRGGT